MHGNRIVKFVFEKLISGLMQLTLSLRLSTIAVTLVSLALVGCTDDSGAVREIQARRQARLQAETKQDHIGDTFNLLSRLVDLNRETADRQIVYHLNQWRQENADKKQPASVAKLVKTISDVIPPEQVDKHVAKEQFLTTDVDHLRDCYIFRGVVSWIDSANNDDPLIQDWLKKESGKLDDDQADQLRSACRFFDWTIRNIAFEPETPPGRTPPSPRMPFGLTINGVGYRQSDYQTIWRGTGDWLQRSGVFTQLCRQAGIHSAVLATQSSKTGELTPWCVGVLIGEEVYLFEPRLGTHVPGPDQVGIATLKQARRDAAVTRRLGVAGFDEFEPRVSKEDIQQCIALLNVSPEAISPRMSKLESGLTGQRRMVTFADVDAEAELWDAASGIAGAQIWKVPIFAEVYASAMEAQSELDPMFAFWHLAKWAIMDGEADLAKDLSRGRWKHLMGEFSDDEESGADGARTLYMAQRAPEFEIQDLTIDVELQKKWFRRELGLSSQQYQQQIAQIQMMMRMGKRTASYWLSLVQYDDGRIETARNWFEQRVLDENQVSHWQPAARYNLGRVSELMDLPEKAIELYKTSGDPQEHGNRIRARLLAKATQN